jgi:hypothetical protein
MSTMCTGERLTCNTGPQILREPKLLGAALGLCAAVIWGSYLASAQAGVNADLGLSDIALLRGARSLRWRMNSVFRRRRGNCLCCPIRRISEIPWAGLV